MTGSSLRLAYAKINAGDFGFCRRYYQDEDCTRFTIGRPLTDEEMPARFEKILRIGEHHEMAGMFGVFLKESQTPIGLAKFELFNGRLAEVGYGLFPEFWRQGYASEILAWLINHSRAFPGLEELVGIINPLNDASRRVLTKQGFRTGGLVEGHSNPGDECLYRSAIPPLKSH